MVSGDSPARASVSLSAPINLTTGDASELAASLSSFNHYFVTTDCRLLKNIKRQRPYVLYAFSFGLHSCNMLYVAQQFNINMFCCYVEMINEDSSLN